MHLYLLPRVLVVLFAFDLVIGTHVWVFGYLLR